MKRPLPLLLLLLLLLGIEGVAWLHPDQRPGVRAPADPVQVLIPGNAPVFHKGDWTIRPLASYDITARVLHKKRYYVGADADLAPYDVAVGWGPMSDSAVLRQLDISQGNRFFFWEWRDHPPIPEDQIICHAANMHLIPSGTGTWWKLWSASAGSVVHMTGCLVEATHAGNPGHPWRSSLSRTDTGNGACELMWVDTFATLPPAQ